MNEPVRSLYDLKRTIYLWVLPFIFTALILNSFLQNTGGQDTVSQTMYMILAFWFLISWILLYMNSLVRFAEYSNLVLISIYHINTVFDSIFHYMLKSDGGELGDFIVWMPLYNMFIFLTLGVKRGLYFSIFIFAVTFINGMVVIDRLPKDSIDSLSQFYFANFVYLIVLYFAQYLFRAFTEVELVKKHAYLDSLTGIANRHQIDGWLEKKLTDSQFMHISFSVIFFDIDYFKEINDRYGHKIGDSVLIELAQLIQKNLSPRNFFGRWGGEEFIVISDVPGNHALKIAEDFRSIVESHEFKGAGRLTASFGVTDAREGDTIDSLLSRVDEGLYHSKKRGRNKVSVC